jgi:hypothetical protein
VALFYLPREFKAKNNSGLGTRLVKSAATTLRAPTLTKAKNDLHASCSVAHLLLRWQVSHGAGS